MILCASPRDLKLKKLKGVPPRPTELKLWLERFDADQMEAAKDFWYEMLKGINESLCETF